MQDIFTQSKSVAMQKESNREINFDAQLKIALIFSKLQCHFGERDEQKARQHLSSLDYSRRRFIHVVNLKFVNLKSGVIS